MPPGTDDVIQQISRRLDGEQVALVATAEREIYQKLRSYELVPHAEVTASIRRNIRRAISTLSTGCVPDNRVGDEAVTTTRERSAEGVPIEDILRAYRLSLHVIYDRFAQLAEEFDAPTAAVLDCSNLLWRLGDWFTAAAAIEYQDAQFDAALRDSIRRTELVRSLLGGDLSTPDIDDVALALDVRRTGTYRAFRVVDLAQPTTCLRRLSRARSHLVIAGETPGTCVGFTDRALDIDPTSWAGVGPDVSLDRLGDSMRVADAIVELLGDRHTGVYDVASLSWRLALASTPAVSRYLHDRYVRPLLDLGEFGELVLTSVRAYLESDMNARDASDALVIHRNTLRYRIAKFEDVTESSFSRTRDIVDVTLALGLPPNTSGRPQR